VLSSFGSSIPATTSTAFNVLLQPVTCQTDSVIQFAPILQFRRLRRNVSAETGQCILAVAETRPKPYVRSVSAP